MVQSKGIYRSHKFENFTTDRLGTVQPPPTARNSGEKCAPRTVRRSFSSRPLNNTLRYLIGLGHNLRLVVEFAVPGPVALAQLRCRRSSEGDGGLVDEAVRGRGSHWQLPRPFLCRWAGGGVQVGDRELSFQNFYNGFN